MDRHAARLTARRTTGPLRRALTQIRGRAGPRALRNGMSVFQWRHMCGIGSTAS